MSIIIVSQVKNLQERFTKITKMQNKNRWDTVGTDTLSKWSREKMRKSVVLKSKHDSRWN